MNVTLLNYSQDPAPAGRRSNHSMPHRVYYHLKPFIPWSARIGLRRWRARWLRRAHSDTWPIMEQAARPPRGWPGWPEGKRFAFVLTHDVEGQKGVARTLPLSELDAAYGMRSSFNFVPEGDYRVPYRLRRALQESGFEVGVHDLEHDGFLCRSHRVFKAKAQRINGYLKEWEAAGFRAGFMHHNLTWFHDLEVLYDSSTFDTDPFEPQPEGVNSIFPFWVPGQGGRGYAELPYTLVQDFSLFIVLRERTIDIWKRKLAWIVQKGGMALLDVHPDYLNFTGKDLARDEFSADLYRGFLAHLRDKYAGQYWQPLPREMAKYVAQIKPLLPGSEPAELAPRASGVPPELRAPIFRPSPEGQIPDRKAA